MLYIFTTCALNFVPCAKILAKSVRETMPDARMVLALSDRKPNGFRLEDEGFDEVLYLDDFIDRIENPLGWAFGHTIMELATALKPFTAAKLMERDDCDAVMFFDPDCVVLEPMEEMRAALQEHSVLLTPHASDLHENDKWTFFEKNQLKVGAFNLGFFALRNSEEGRAVASWWRHRLKEGCVIDPSEGLFTDQKWMDLLPCYTNDLKVMRQPHYNVARWNTFQ
ncbi:MAG: glycosyl transferase, partial [Pseudomonadota bacterium]